ncbi:PREDICTED: ankyrin repeat and SOCS box protein 18 [Tinamus guttatus]|uniref:ankyrin repeat and SOCS box protein 18 n=1 Tax=Tinamus guttatus TaxID=94827 RepID=UPI00052EF98B|nr:PREDICTED: ankyrin repeat and SOCS box protein 18 [Tinamus guttatus]
MGELPGPVTETLRLSGKSDPAQWPAAPAYRYYTALLSGDLSSLEVLTDRYHQDVNAVFEISHDELEWRVRSPASYGLSGTSRFPGCAALLLEHGADPQLRSHDGRAPLHFCTAPASLGFSKKPPSFKPGPFEQAPSLSLLLNHGAQKIWPGAFVKQHPAFYESLFGLAGRARSLQHLCRSAIRKVFGSKCHRLVPLLPVPKALHGYLLLEPEGTVL